MDTQLDAKGVARSARRGDGPLLVWALLAGSTANSYIAIELRWRKREGSGTCRGRCLALYGPSRIEDIRTTAQRGPNC